MAKTIVMSLGGSLIAPEKIDITFLKKFRKLILAYTQKGNRVIIICGGGNTARNYHAAARSINPKVSSRDLDWIGIGATKINAELVRAILGDVSHESIIVYPDQKIKTNKKVVVGGGYKPGRSSDMASVVIAKVYGADTVINLSNITYVYNKDPKKFKDAKAYKKIDWKNFQKLVGNKWTPGAHVPFDPVATRLAAKEKMTLVVMKGSDLGNLEKMLSGKPFKGTIVS